MHGPTWIVWANLTPCSPQAIIEEPEFIEAYVNVAVIHAEQGRSKLAKAEFKKVLVGEKEIGGSGLT